MVKLEIYLLQQTSRIDYDQYDSVVVIAENEESARQIHPSEFVTHVKNNKWMGTYHKGGEYVYNDTDWVSFDRINKLKVTHIGTANKDQIKGVILASFNAG